MLFKCTELWFAQFCVQTYQSAVERVNYRAPASSAFERSALTAKSFSTSHKFKDHLFLESHYARTLK